MADGQGGVGSRFSLRADLVTKYAGRPPKTLTGDVLAPSLAGRRAGRKPCLPTSTFLVKVRSGFYGRTEPEDTFYYFSYRTWWSRPDRVPTGCYMAASRRRDEKRSKSGGNRHDIQPAAWEASAFATKLSELAFRRHASTYLNM